MKTESTTTITAAELIIGNKIINKYGDTFKVSDIEKNKTCIWVQGFFQSKKVWVNDCVSHLNLPTTSALKI